MMSYKENLQKCHEYVRALEEERRKIEMFQRELPLCLEIVSQTIESCKQQLSGTTTATATTATTTTTTECSEQTTSDGLVFEEFIPVIKTTADGEEDLEEQQQQQQQQQPDDESHKNDDGWKKSDWLRSAQLWNQSPDLGTPTTTNHQKVAVVEVPSKATAMTKMTTTTTTSATDDHHRAASACSTAPSKKQEEAQNRKARRCWSPELHRRFLNALQQLGGPHVATPKQIRELMKVDGLTNDEVKSHLQKYRLHSTRRPTSTTMSSHHHHNNNNNGVGSTQAPPRPHQFVVVGGIWVPPPHSREATTTTGGAPGVAYAAPVAPPTQQQQHPAPQATMTSQSAGSHSENGTRCNSPATSSSARAATASPAC